LKTTHIVSNCALLYRFKLCSSLSFQTVLFFIVSNCALLYRFKLCSSLSLLLCGSQVLERFVMTMPWGPMTAFIQQRKMSELEEHEYHNEY